MSQGFEGYELNHHERLRGNNHLGISGNHVTDMISAYEARTANLLMLSTSLLSFSLGSGQDYARGIRLRRIASIRMGIDPDGLPRS